MVTHFRLRIFDVFTLFVYMFTHICTALPQPAMRLVSLPPQPWPLGGSKRWLVIWAPGKFIIFSFFSFLTNFFICF